ncbi:hypothetical protein Tco_1109952, partial [Tanacetum coccineum]
IIADLMKKFPNIPQRIDEYYHSIKDDIPLVSVYTTGNVLVRGMLILDEFLIEKICATNDYKEYETVAYKTPTLTAASPRRKKRKQSVGETSSPKKSLKITIRQKHVDEGEKDKQFYDEADDSDDRLEPGSHKENPEHVDDDDDDEEKELTDTVSLPAATTSKDPHSKRRISSKYSHLPGALHRMCRRQGYMIKNMELKHDDHQEDDAPPEEEKRVKRHKTSKSSKSARGSSSKQSDKDSITYVSKQQQEWDAWVEETVIDEDEVILKDETPKLITEFQNIDKRVPTIFDRARMEATLNDMLSNQFKNAEEYAYYLEQATNFMENQIVWESRQEDIRRPVPRPLIFFGPQRNTNEPPRIITDQPHGLDFMEQIIVMRENDKPDSFSEADFKYLNKNDIEDLYYLCQNKKLGIESYQVKVNLTAPTLTFPGIEAYEPYSIVDKPNTGLIYLNCKNEKRVMYLVEIVKFFDATLEKVLKKRNNQASKTPRADEEMGIFCKWKTNSTDDEASAVPAVPDISGGRSANQEAAPRYGDGCMLLMEAAIAYDYFKENLSALENGNNLSGCEYGIHKFEYSQKLFELSKMQIYGGSVFTKVKLSVVV